MFSGLFRYQTIAKTRLPLTVLNSRRSFIASSFVSNNKQDDNNGDKKGNSEQDNKQEDKQENIKPEHTQENSESKEAQQDNKPSVEHELKTLSAKFKEMQSAYLLSLADQENLRQRTMKEVANAKEYSIQKFAKDLLDSVDILDMALKSVPEEFREKENCAKKESKEISKQLADLYTGVSMTETELLKTLKQYGVEMDNPIDQEFDPNKHEAVFQTAVPDKKPGTIFVVHKVGYLLKDRVLRAAQVGVVAEN